MSMENEQPQPAPEPPKTAAIGEEQMTFFKEFLGRALDQIERIDQLDEATTDRILKLYDKLCRLDTTLYRLESIMDHLNRLKNMEKLFEIFPTAEEFKAFLAKVEHVEKVMNE